MKTNQMMSLTLCGLLAVSCGSKEKAEKDAAAAPTVEQILSGQPETRGTLVENVELTTPLNQEWVKEGETVYNVKCLGCHKLTGDRIVGPGWAGVTKKRKPEWIMNMILNVDMMLDSDEEAQKLLEQCLVRMPNQNLAHEEARAVVEFMRHNDGEQ